MDFFHEYGLLIAVAAPVGAIVIVNFTLFITGERGTLLLPWVHDYPAVPLDEPFEPQVPAIKLAEAPSPLEQQPVEELREAA